jgi:hypothetical protein
MTAGLVGCDDCTESTPAIQGICEPRIQVGTRADLSIVYESDVGPMPLMATSALIGDTGIATLEQGPTPDRISITGIAVGETTVELRLRGYDEPVWFSLSIESDPLTYECDGRDPPGFDIDGTGQPPQ